jgi:hypothetical protein
MIRHVVLMVLRDGTSDADVERIGQALDQCASKLDYVVAMQHGRNLPFDTPSPKAGYAVVVDFASVEDCLRYDTDPEHDVVREAVMPCVASALVANIELEGPG